MRGNFAVQLSDNGRFTRVETDKVIIEITLNKETKLQEDALVFNKHQRWKINATYQVAYRTCFQEHLNYHLSEYQHTDLNSSRFKKEGRGRYSRDLG